jgi:hypothetical protein
VWRLSDSECCRTLNVLAKSNDAWFESCMQHICTRSMLTNSCVRFAALSIVLGLLGVPAATFWRCLCAEVRCALLKWHTSSLANRCTVVRERLVGACPDLARAHRREQQRVLGGCLLCVWQLSRRRSLGRPCGCVECFPACRGSAVFRRVPTLHHGSHMASQAAHTVVGMFASPVDILANSSGTHAGVFMCRLILPDSFVNGRTASIRPVLWQCRPLSNRFEDPWI